MDSTVPVYYCRKHDEVNDSCTDREVIGYVVTHDDGRVSATHVEGGRHV